MLVTVLHLVIAYCVYKLRNVRSYDRIGGRYLAALDTVGVSIAIAPMFARGRD